MKTKKDLPFLGDADLFGDFEFGSIIPETHAPVCEFHSPDPPDEEEADLSSLFASEPEVVDLRIAPAPPPVWREREFISTECRPDGVILQKLGSKAVSAIPCSLVAGAKLSSYLYMQDKLGEAHLFPDSLIPDTGIRNMADDGRIHFAMADFLLPGIKGAAYDPATSRVASHLEAIGLEVFIAPSLAGWARKEYRRREREHTPFDLPVIQDDRPMYDRMEIGLVVQCLKNRDQFAAGQEYVVVETDRGSEAEDGSSPEAAEKAAVGLKRRGHDSSKVLWFAEMDGDMAEYFSLESDAMKAFDPDQTFVKKYPELYHQARKTVEKLGQPVFDYIGSDTAQAVYYRNIMFTHPPRQGKTSAIFQYAEAAGSKKCLLVTVANGVDVFAQEAKRLGITDYVVVRKLADFDKPAKYYITSYSWLKSAGRTKVKEDKHAGKPKQICPHCGEMLVRPERSLVRNAIGHPILDEFGKPDLRLERTYQQGVQKLKWTQDWGYVCRNPACGYLTSEVSTGAAWTGQKREVKAYVDLARAAHARCIDTETAVVKGRMCQTCGHVAQEYTPGRYRRIRDRFSLIAVDEIHNVKNPKSDMGRAILGMMHARRRIGATGTLMPNTPSDAFHPLGWTFGYGSHRFEYPRGDAGLVSFNNDYTETIMVESENSSYAKRVPFIRRPIQFWSWKASRCLFRSYTDPYVIESMAKAGLVIPKFRPVVSELQPDVKQAMLLVGTIASFDQIFKNYSEDLKKKAKESEKSYLMNSAQILARMSQMRMAATCPGRLNERLMAAGSGSVYAGSYGGAKMQRVAQIVAEKADKGEKVVIFSDMPAMREHMAKELVGYNPITFQVSWNREKRTEAFRKFREDPDHVAFICGPRSVRESIDLSSANTVISTDLLWSPGIQTQAWSRVLTPRQYEREVECHVLLVKYSIDSHVYGTFYSKIAAAEQALYGRQISKADKAIDIQYFVDQVVAEKNNILQWLIEAGEDNLSYMPVFKTLQQLENWDAAA